MKPLHKYIIKRLISYFGTLFGAITITFFLFRLMPGNPLDAFIGSLMATQYVQAEFARQVIEEYKATFGLEGSLLTQYLCFLKQLVRGNLGPSLIAFPNPAQVVILKRLPWTIGLLGLSTIISWVLGVVIGTLAAWRRESKFDRVISNLAIILSQIPYYIMAVVLVLVFSYILGWFPSRGAYDPGLTPGLTLDFIISVIKHGFLPALSLVLTQSFGWLLSSRYLTISILAEDFLIFAEAKGLKPRRIFQRYVFRNILLPQVTGLGMSLGFIMGGQIVLETIFSYPGIGSLFAAALGVLDYNVVYGVLLLQIFVVLTANLILDLTYPLIDPRVKYHD